MATIADGPEWYDERQAARILGVSDRTLRSWRKDRRIGFHYLPGRRVRYSLDQLAAFRAACRVEPGADDAGADE